MSDEVVFQHLFEVAKNSKDPKGVVAACLVNDGSIVLSAGSADDGVRHAEDLLLEETKEQKVINDSSVLYCTLEPCNKRTNPSLVDCTTLIIKSRVRKVVFGACDPDHSEVTAKKFMEAGVHIRQVEDPDIIARCATVFNESTTVPSVKLKPQD
jgi:pyrimidine deaminase RibD-like protein